jgi:hypothetical protein
LLILKWIGKFLPLNKDQKQVLSGNRDFYFVLMLLFDEQYNLLKFQDYQEKR